MSTNSFAGRLAGVCLAATLSMTVAPQSATAAVIGVDIDNSGSAIVNPPFTIGWAFDLTANNTVSALGIWDEGSDGLSERHEVALWNNSGTLLASTILGAGASGDQVVASASQLGSWRFNDIAPLVLTPGTYVLGTVSGSDAFRTFVQSITLDPAISNFDSGKYSSGGTLAFPTLDESSAFSLFGPNLILNGTQVPTPGSLALLGLGVLGLLHVRRRTA